MRQTPIPDPSIPARLTDIQLSYLLGYIWQDVPADVREKAIAALPAGDDS